MAPLAETSTWPAALEAVDDDRRRRAVAEKAREAYASDCRQFAAWAEKSDPAHPVDPAGVDVRTLRRFAAAQSETGIAPSTIRRRAAALAW